RLQGEEVLVRFQVGIILADRNETAERPGQLRLRLLEFPNRLRVGELVGADLHLRRLGTRFDHLGQHLPLLPRVAADSFDQVRYEFGAPLLLVLDLAPGGFRPLFQRRNGVDPAARQENGCRNERAEQDKVAAEDGRAEPRFAVNARCAGHGCARDYLASSFSTAAAELPTFFTAAFN